MATTALLRAYLEWQSEMGTEEVMLTHPFSSKHPATARQEADQKPDLRHSGANWQSSEAGLFSKPKSPQAQGVIEGLVQTLTEALAGSSHPAQPDFDVPKTPGRPPRLPETASLPVFMGLPDFWEYMEKHPHVLLGETLPAGPVAGESQVTRMVPGVGPAHPPLALVGFEPVAADETAGKPFQGDAGALLEKMMRAIKVELTTTYLTNLIKLHITGKVWSRRELARLVPLLHIELGLIQAPHVLLLGQECAQTVLKTGKTVAELRQETHRMDGREFFVTYHPQDLLRKEELKRSAWEDLQWLQRRLTEAQVRG